MKPLAYRLLLAAAFAVTACGGASTPNPAPTSTPTPVPSSSPMPDGWEVLPSSPVSPANSRHDDVVFLDPSNGWLVNVRAEVHGSRDGGATWTPLAKLASDVFLRCVGFASRTKGWAGNLNVTSGHVTPDYALWETQDGGRTWSNISSRIRGAPVAGLCGMRVVSPEVIVAVGRWSGPAVFVKSTDGGRTWTSRSLSDLTSGLVASSSSTSTTASRWVPSATVPPSRSSARPARRSWPPRMAGRRGRRAT